MRILHLVRHGQASFGADDDDHLSDPGARQSVQLGRYFAAKGLTFDAVLTGTLRRHTQTLASICEGMDQPLRGCGNCQCPVYGERWRDAVPGAASAVWLCHTSDLERRNAPKESQAKEQVMALRALRGRAGISWTKEDVRTSVRLGANRAV